MLILNQFCSRLIGLPLLAKPILLQPHWSSIAGSVKAKNTNLYQGEVRPRQEIKTVRHPTKYSSNIKLVKEAIALWKDLKLFHLKSSPLQLKALLHQIHYALWCWPSYSNKIWPHKLNDFVLVHYAIWTDKLQNNPIGQW